MDKSKTRLSIAKAIKLLAADCNQEIKDIENLIEAWHITLESVTDEEIWHGLKKALERSDKFLIGSGEFKELALTGEGVGGYEDEAREAWNLVRMNLNSYSSPVFKNSVISETIRKMGGWRNLCMMLTTELPFREKDFIAHYRVYKSRNGDYHQNVLRYDKGKNFSFIGFDNNEDIKLVNESIKGAAKIESKAYKMLGEGAGNGK